MSLKNSFSELKPSIKIIERTAYFLLGIGLLILVIGVTMFFWEQGDIDSDLQADTSLLSDLGSFLAGTVGLTWSLASVILFYLALQQQRKDLESQSKTVNIQRFENTFFQLLQLHTNTVKDLSHKDPYSKLSVGKDVFSQWKESLDNLSQGITQDSIYNETTGEYSVYDTVSFKSKEELEAALGNGHYYSFYRQFENNFNHYFRQLFHVFKYVDTSPLVDDKDRKFYARLVRAQLSQNELYALLFNCLISGYGYPKFMALVKKYDLLKNFNPDHIPNKIVWEYFNHKLETV